VSTLFLNRLPRATMALSLAALGLTWLVPPGQPIARPFFVGALAAVITLNLLLFVQAVRRPAATLGLWVGASAVGHACWVLAGLAMVGAHPPWLSDASAFVGSLAATALQWVGAALFVGGVLLHSFAWPHPGESVHGY